jgi:hypothetical protein
MIEREDFASGTSSKSTKLVHGGVRYLEKAGRLGLGVLWFLVFTLVLLGATAAVAALPHLHVLAASQQSWCTVVYGP